MTSALQNRLVGTIIVVAIAVIFLPDLLGGKKQVTQNTFVDLPPKPEVRKVEVPSDIQVDKIKAIATRQVEVISEQAVDEPLADIEQSKAADMTSNQLQDSSTVVIKTKNEPVATALAIEKTIELGSLEKDTIVDDSAKSSEISAGWVVQLGSFRHKKNVNDLLNLLEKAGYRAFSRPVNTSSGVLTKVFVGPDLQKSKLEESLSHLKEVTKLQGRVTPFTVQ
ncbi:MAG: SPOR domain-containing protein [Paraglaciecola sp.]|uniref:SPOR domain-containing protein n=1 Tax=Paraglaciecola sp. TaxID=1920173 RepID=UPI0032985B3E